MREIRETKTNENQLNKNIIHNKFKKTINS